jgi:hypothetical protein
VGLGVPMPTFWAMAALAINKNVRKGISFFMGFCFECENSLSSTGLEYHKWVM